jgi:hypothetical protein
MGLIVVFLLVGCDNRFEYELPVNKPRMVVNLVSRDTQPWTGTLTLSWPILEYGDLNRNSVPGGLIKVYEGDSLIETIIGVNNHDYNNLMTLASRPMPGKTYTIEATSPEYGLASATYVQPMPVPIEKIEIELVGPDPRFQNEDAIEFRITFVDPPGENYYQIDALAGWDSLDLRGGSYQPMFVDPVYEDKDPFDFYKNLYFDDEYFEGQRVTMTIRARAQFDSLYDTLHPEHWYDYHWVTLRNISRSYYRYLITMDLASEVWDDPYAQPVKVETNVKNGFGVVGGWTMTVKGKPFVY